VSDQQLEINAHAQRKEELQKENESFKKMEKDQPKELLNSSKLEKEVIEKVMGLPDFTLSAKIVQNLYFAFMQKQHSILMGQQMAQMNSEGANSGVTNGGEQFSSNGMMFMPSQPMMNPMQYSGYTGYQDLTTQQKDNTSSNATSKKQI
jgi:hypothetical protein